MVCVCEYRNNLALLATVSVPNAVEPATSGDSMTLRLGKWIGIPGLPYIVSFLLQNSNCMFIIWLRFDVLKYFNYAHVLMMSIHSHLAKLFKFFVICSSNILVHAWTCNYRFIDYVLILNLNYVKTLYKASDPALELAAGLNTFNPQLKLNCLPLWIVLQSLGHDGIVDRIKHCCNLASVLKFGFECVFKAIFTYVGKTTSFISNSAYHF